MPVLLRHRITDGRGRGQHTSQVDLSGLRLSGRHRSAVRLGLVRQTGIHVSRVQLGEARGQGQHTSVVQLRRALAPVPTVTRSGIPPLRWVVECSLGKVIDLRYDHTGDDETAVLTLLNAARPTGGRVSFSVTAQGYSGRVQATLEVDAEQYERQVLPDGSTLTTVRAFNADADAARSTRLPELVEWKLLPRNLRGIPCTQRPAPRSVGVLDLVRLGFQAARINFLLVGGDPLQGRTWLEGIRDVSTRNRTPSDLFAEAYGALGYRLIVRGNVLYGLPPRVPLGGGGVQLSARQLSAFTERTERANVPSLIRLTGGDLRITKPDLTTFASDAPDPDAWTRAVSTTDAWTSVEYTADGGQTMTGYTKERGQITRTVDVTTGRVEVNEEGVVRSFHDVLVGYTVSESVYARDCAEQLLWQRSTKRTFGYSASTQTQLVGVLGELVGGIFPAGDLTGDDTEVVQQFWGPDGLLRGRLTSTRRLTGLNQAAAEDSDLSARGPLVGREYQSEVLREEYVQMGGQWLRRWRRDGASNIPVYDLETQVPVRLSVRAGSLGSGREVLSGPPESVNCLDQCPEPLSFPNRTAARVTGGGAAEVDVSLPMVDTTNALRALLPKVALANGPRRTFSLGLEQALAVLPGTQVTGLASGICTRYGLTVQNGLPSFTAEVVDQTAPGIILSEEDALPERGMMLWRADGGVTVAVLRELNGSTPAFDLRFVRAGAGINPAPGELVEFTSSPGGALVLTGGWGE